MVVILLNLAFSPICQLCQLCQLCRLDIELGWKVILQIHDEVICEGPEESHEEAMDIVVGTMERPFEMPLRVKLEVDAKCDVSWFLAK